MNSDEITVSAPGKFILFGEHAVVYGEPAVALAINLRTRVRIREAEEFSVNGRPLTDPYNRYIRTAIELYYDGPAVEFWTESSIPSASGLGSSAAITTSTVGALMKKKGEFQEDKLAKNAFEVEYEVQGKASPTDTSISTHGSGILLTREPGEELLWSVRKGETVWYINHIDAPELTMVVGNTGLSSSTSRLVAMVKRYAESNTFARDIIREIGNLTLEGIGYLKSGDKERLGECMSRNHKLLANLGVNHPALQRLVDAASRHSYGAKLTGAGGGGSMIALTDEPEIVAEAIRKAGGAPYIVRVSKIGVSVE